MPKKILILLTSIIFFIVLGLMFSLGLPKNSQNNKTNLLTITPVPRQNTSIYAANFVLQSSPTNIKTDQVVPVTLKAKIEKDPSQKGITGIRAIINSNPQGIFALQPEDIQETLPKPWQYMRKEVGKNGEITIEAIYLQPGETGDITKEISLAVLNFSAKKTGKLELRVDNQQSKILTKDNIAIPLTLDVYSNYEVDAK